MTEVKSSTLIAIDTNVLVWGVRKDAKSPPEMKRRAAWLFDSFEDQNVQVIVPTVVVAEYLVPTPVIEHAKILEAIREKFLVYDFTDRCASLAAELFAESLRAAKKDPSLSRSVLKADAMIVATAKMAGVERIYSHDPGLRKIAQKCGLKPSDLPTIAPTIFEVN